MRGKKGMIIEKEHGKDESGQAPARTYRCHTISMWKRHATSAEFNQINATLLFCRMFHCFQSIIAIPFQCQEISENYYSRLHVKWAKYGWNLTAKFGTPEAHFGLVTERPSSVHWRCKIPLEVQPITVSDNCSPYRRAIPGVVRSARPYP